MKRKVAALVLCCLLLLSTTHVSASGSVYFTAVNDSVLPLTDETMPFWSSGFLYIASSLFVGDVRKELGIGYIYPAANNLLILYGSGRSLQFDLTKSYAQDHEGNAYFPPAVLRGDVVFVPASVVADFFGLTYSITGVKNGYLVRLRLNGENSLPEDIFVDAAANRMADRYSRYLKSKEPVQTEEPETTQPIEDVFSGKSIYLCVKASDPAAVTGLLDTLDRKDMQATFFCTEGFLNRQGDLLRRMVATGQSIGIFADGADSDRSVGEQLRAGNEALRRATCGMTRLALVENGSAQTLQEITKQGFSLLTPTLDRSGFGLKSSRQAATLLRQVTDRRGDVSLWLGESVNAAGTQAFLTAAQKEENRCQALTELTA